MKLYWKDVIRAYNLNVNGYNACREFVIENTTYKYIAFNEYVYHIDDKDMDAPLCLIEDLM